MAGTKAPRRKGLKKASAKKPSEKQARIPGTEPERVAAVERATADYAAVRDERMGLTEDEVKLKAKLIEVMKQHGLTTYNFDGYMVELEHIDEDNVKVKKARAAKQDGSQA